MKTSDRPRVLLSQCLTGAKVRYDGRDKFNALCTQVLSRHFCLIPLCPEMLAGMPSPRPPIDLHLDSGSIRVFNRTLPDIDPTDAIIAIARKTALTTSDLAGFIGVSRSPSCANTSGRLYEDQALIANDHPGLFTYHLQQYLPGLPVIEDEALADPKALDAFITAVTAFHQRQATGQKAAGNTRPDHLQRGPSA